MSPLLPMTTRISKLGWVPDEITEVHDTHSSASTVVFHLIFRHVMYIYTSFCHLARSPEVIV